MSNIIGGINETKIYYIATKPKSDIAHYPVMWKPCNLDISKFKEIELIQLGSVGKVESDIDTLDMMRGIMDNGDAAILLGIYKGSKNKIILTTKS